MSINNLEIMNKRKGKRSVVPPLCQDCNGLGRKTIRECTRNGNVLECTMCGATYHPHKDFGVICTNCNHNSLFMLSETKTIRSFECADCGYRCGYQIKGSI